ncbi:DUF29 domain-containing protein [Methylomagnum sp.]
MSTGYEQDFFRWTQEQAGLLRSGLIDRLDIENLIEEIESMGRSEKHELVSRLRVLVMHLLKWRYQPAKRSPSWLSTITEQRASLDTLLEDSPSLQSGLLEALEKTYLKARKAASLETEIPLNKFPEICPFSLGQILDDDYFPNSEG